MPKHLQHFCGGRPIVARVMAALLQAVILGFCAPVVVKAEPSSIHRKSAAAEARRVEIKVNGPTTTFLLGLSSGVRAEIFTLANPYRVVIDLPDVAFQLPEGAGRKGQGLIAAYRYGLLAAGRGRIVIDTSGPVIVKRAALLPRAGKEVEFAVELGPTSVKSFAGGTGVSQTAGVTPPPEAVAPAPARHDRLKPVVLIDAGHGGIDPGAASLGGLKEKMVVLAVAKALRERLAASGRYDVRMTRTGDVFISLDQRLKMSRDLAADLFISLHADAIAQKGFAKSVRGATVYTLSERASDEEARRMAEKENNSDAVAGLQTAKFEEEGEVRNILIDLMKRETSNFSADFSNSLVKQLSSTISLSGTPQRSAAFKVLRQADTPSVLIELGYMSHPEDEKLLNAAAWQRRVAAAVGTAIDSYFSKRTARAR